MEAIAVSLGPPDMPVRYDSFVDGVCTQSIQDEQKNTHGKVSVIEQATVSNIPYNIQQMSAGEAQRYGKLSALALFDLYIPVLRPDTGAALVVGSRDYFTIGSEKYAVLGSAIPQGSSGKQKVPVQRRDR